MYYSPPSCREGYIILPGGTSIDGIADDRRPSGTRYFNLQGMPVENPSNGIFIMQKDGVTTKTVIR